MTNYSVKCFVLEPSKILKDTIIELVSEYEFIVDKGWEHGYHLNLRGALNKNDLEYFVKKLERGVSESGTSYDENEFIQKYKPMAKILRRSEPFNPIYQGKVTVNIEELVFEKELEDKLFRKTNHIYDSYYCKSYFNKNSLYKVIEETLKFCKKLEQYERPGSVEESAYNCHLSHYIAFIHRLNKQEKESIENQFRVRYENDLRNGLLDFDLTPTSLTEDLIGLFHQVKPLVKSKELNFYMPFERKHIDEKIEFSSKRHQVTFSEENMNQYFLYDEVTITNRWAMNALYKKLLLLGLSNMDRFYMNYVISKSIYPEYALNDYAVEYNPESVPVN